MKRSVGVWAVAAGWALAGCGEMAGYSGGANITLPPHIQRVSLRPFQNRTQFFGLEDKLRLRVEQEFIRDGRLPYVSTEATADGIVEGEIVNYIRQVTTYDAANQPLEYRLWVIMDVRFLDRVENRVLWEEKRLEGDYIYVVETQPAGLTEEEARERLWDLFARDIVKRTLEGFGSVTGASARKVPEKTIPAPDALPPVPAPPEETDVPSPPPY